MEAVIFFEQFTIGQQLVVQISPFEQTFFWGWLE